MIAGFLLALLTAVSESTKDFFSKRSLKKVDEYAASFSLRFFALPFVLPLLLFTGVPSLNTNFWLALLVGGSLNIITTILFMKAIKKSPLSLTVPMTAFTPVFLLLTSPLILNEFPTSIGILGIVLTVLGSYLLNFKNFGEGVFHPFKAMVKEGGPRLMLIVAFIWSITSVIDKVGVLNSNAIFWIVANSLYWSVILGAIMFFRRKNSFGIVSANIKNLLPQGFFQALTLIFQMTAITLIQVSYVISIKRTSAIFSSIYGFVFFKEKNILQRVIAILIMISGVFLIAIFGK